VTKKPSPPPDEVSATNPSAKAEAEAGMPLGSFATTDQKAFAEQRPAGIKHQKTVEKEHKIYAQDRRGGNHFMVGGKRVHEDDLSKEQRNKFFAPPPQVAEAEDAE
jgi:hypothetical protein